LWAPARFDGCRDCGERRITSPVSELLPERVSSELPHLQVKLAAQLPYRQVAAFSFGNQIYICTATRYHNLVKSTVSYSLQCPNSLGWEYLPRPYHSGVRTCTLPKLRVKCSVSRSSLIYKVSATPEFQSSSERALPMDRICPGREQVNAGAEKSLVSIFECDDRLS
jgi:hypothetical protein